METITILTRRDCTARYVPSGELTTIPKDEFVNVTQSLGGNFTVTWRGNMLRIDGTDADALGQENEKVAFDDDGSGQIDKNLIWQALDTIFDPEIPVSIVQLGLIYDLEVDVCSGSVRITMTLTAPGCGMGPVLVSDVEYRVSKVPNVKAVEVNIVFDPPWDQSMMSLEAQLESGLLF